MQSLKDARHLYETEFRAYHLERPGFRISEIRIGPTQSVPWHYHSHIEDTFYVIEGRLRIFLRDPKEELSLGSGDSYVVYALGKTGEPDANDQHIVHLVDWLLQYAFEQRASDIHLEPRRDVSKVRFRIDGVLHVVNELPTVLPVVKDQSADLVRILGKYLPTQEAIEISTVTPKAEYVSNDNQSEQFIAKHLNGDIDLDTFLDIKFTETDEGAGGGEWPPKKWPKRKSG